MSVRRRLAAAAGRRLHGPYLALERIDARLDELQSRLASVERSATPADELRSRLAGLEQGAAAAAETHELHERLSMEMRAMLRALVAEEAENRRRLYRLRAAPGYDAAWTEPTPLVSVTVATRARAKLLAERALPSILGQSYGNLEVLVVGDHADDATAEAVRALGDPRVTYSNLTQRLEFAADAETHWLAAATMARNEATRLATGRWLVAFDDDDAMAPDCVERLLARAREDRFEVAYGRTRVHRLGEPETVIGAFPPRPGEFTWASAIHHCGLRFIARELHAADLGVPGDWYQAERMLRAGVRFGWVGDVLADIYPSRFNEPQPME